MKLFKWKTFIITGIVCLLPILFGVLLWNKLPDIMAIHFNIYGEPDNFASKAFVVFGLPVIMLIVQGFCCFITDLNAKRYSKKNKIENATKWIIPCLMVVLQVITLGYGLGWNIDIRKSVAFIVGVLFVGLGYFLSKLDYIKNYNIDTEKARKINRFIGYETIIMGLLFFISILFPPVCTVVCVFLLIPYAIIGAVYGMVATRRK